MIKTAEISDCGRHRYSLTRSWRHGAASRWVLFIMLNPSTADASEDDPTIRRCISFAELWGFDGLAVVNMYSFRATDPRELWTPGCELNGPLADDFVGAMLLVCADVVCAWGKTGPRADRPKEIYNMIRRYNRTPTALRINKDGNPGHPLYIPKSVERVSFVL